VQSRYFKSVPQSGQEFVAQGVLAEFTNSMNAWDGRLSLIWNPSSLSLTLDCPLGW